MKKLLIITLVLAGLSTCGCTKYWYQDCKSYDQALHDYYACTACANRRIPYESGFSTHPDSVSAECMRAKGYRDVFEFELPHCAKRVGPRDYWDKGWGFAGQWY